MVEVITLETIRRKINTLVTGAHAVILFAVLLFGVVLVRTAWLSDDGYITFRVVDNFIHGYGPCWNVQERVQTYTHPLWMLLLSGVCLITGEIPYTAMFLTIALSLVTVLVVVLAVSKSVWGSLFAVTVLTLSMAFVDYSTCGLENCLSHLVIVVFALVYLRDEPSPRQVFLLSFLASLAMLCRMDLALLLLPALCARVIEVRSAKTFGLAAFGMLPFVAWEVFALIYYGFPFPNPAYAKLGTGIPTLELVLQGLRYYRHSLRTDPITLIVCVTGAAIPVGKRQWRRAWISMGIALYLLYVVRIGGDFMSGRFFTAPLLLSVILITQMGAQKTACRRWLAALAVAIVLGLSSPAPTVLTGSDFGVAPVTGGPLFGRLLLAIPHDFRVRSERFVSYSSTGLLSAYQGTDKAFGRYYLKRVNEGNVARSLNRYTVTKRRDVGLMPFLAGPNVHIIDLCALTDPLLARLPMLYTPNWMIGHFFRCVPEGYDKTLETGVDQFVDRNLAEYYQHIICITRDPIWSLKRFHTILLMNLGSYEHLIDYNRYRRVKRSSKGSRILKTLLERIDLPI